MEKVSTFNYKVRPILIASIILFIGAFYTVRAHADTNIAQPPGTQLAYFIGHTSYYGGYYRPDFVYYGHRHYHHKVFWTGWKYINYGCRQNCLVDRWTGRAIRCSRRC
jgi:hypothetical protein